MRLVPVLLVASCLLSAALAMQTVLDARQVAGQVRRETRPASGVEESSDDGEFLIDTSGVHAEYHPAVAFDGTNFLVVWEDDRNGSYTDIYGARVSQAGVLLDPSGIAISTAANYQSCPAVAFDGTNFLVVWNDWRSGLYKYDIYGARVTPQGVVRDPSGIPISTAVYQEESPALAFDGTDFLVVWEDYRSGVGWDIYGARVTPDGVVLDSSGIPISQAAVLQWHPALAFDGTNFLVVWEDDRSDSYDIYGARVTQRGVVLDPSGLPISTAANDQGSPAVAFDGTNLLVVWEDHRNDYYPDIYGVRVTQAGVVLDPTGIAISTAVFEQCIPAVAFDGTNYLVVWEDYSGYFDIYGARVSQAGVVLDSGPVVRQEDEQSCPALARGAGSQMFLVYQGWAGTVGAKTYNTYRIWGKMNPSPGIEETMNDAPFDRGLRGQRGTMNVGPTIARGVLNLGVDSRQQAADRAELLDAAGRKVAELHPGANDVSRLSPGVYFVREAQTQAQAQAVRKVVVQR